MMILLEMSTSKEKVCRIVVQQCRNATLRFDTEDPQVSISDGMVVFTCFLQGAAQEHLDNIGMTEIIQTSCFLDILIDFSVLFLQ